ncbi:MAG: AI-2E family transporter [Propionibacteriaceae bacterium]|jgi:predicted PurR-regulated permease PerM|nr:AI-2E family transporter [Propionibacteriaceae bacterium]
MAADALDNPLDPPDEAVSGAGSSALIPRTLVILLGLAAAVLIIQGVQPIKSTLAASFMALNLVIVVWPIQQALSRWIPRFLASIVAGLACVAILGGLIWSVGWTIAQLVGKLPDYSERFTELQHQLISLVNQMGIATDNIAWDTILDRLQDVSIPTILNTLNAILSGLTDFVGLFVAILMILVFMVMDSTGFSARMKRLQERHNPTLAWALSTFARGTRKYWVVTTVFGLTVALCNWGLLLGLGVPLATVWATMSFVTNYIPNIGFIIGIIPPTIMALLANGPWTALWVAVGYTIFNTVLQTFIQPKFTGDAVGITPTVAVLSLLIWSYVLGPLGALLAVPSTLLVKTLLVDIDPRTRWLNVLIASNPRTSDQDPEEQSTLVARAKRVRKLTAVLYRNGASSRKGGAAASELADLKREDEQPTKKKR